MSPKLTPSGLEIHRLLGEGNFSRVYNATLQTTNENVALKVVDWAQVRKLHKEKEILMEKHCLLKLNPDSYRDQTTRSFSFPSSLLSTEGEGKELALNHGRDHIVKLYHTYKTDTELCFVMELCDDQELWDMVKGIGVQSSSRLRWITSQILSALRYMHSKRIVHRDLKAENIVVSKSENRLKLVDFGTAMDEELPRDDTLAGNSHLSFTGRQSTPLRYFVGTPHFMAPEAKTGKGALVSRSSDIWSFGCLLYQLATGAPPFLAPSDYLVFVRCHFADIDIPVYLDPLLSDVIRDCIKPQPDERPDLIHLMARLCVPDKCLCQVAGTSAHHESGVYEAFRRRLTFIRKLMFEAITAAGHSEQEHYTPHWLLDMYPKASKASVLLSSETLLRHEEMINTVILKPWSPVWIEIFECVMRSYDDTPTKADSRATDMQVLQTLATPGREEEIKALCRSSEEFWIAADCYVRLAFDTLRLLDTQDRVDDHWIEISNRWLAVLPKGDLPANLPFGEMEDGEVADLKGAEA